MRYLVKEALVSLKKNITNYISLFVFIFLSVIVFTSMASTSLELTNSIADVQNNSLEYDYQINTNQLLLMENDASVKEELNKYYDSDSSSYSYDMFKNDLSNSYIEWNNSESPTSENINNIDNWNLTFNSSSPESVTGIKEDNIKDLFINYPLNNLDLTPILNNEKIYVSPEALEILILKDELATQEPKNNFLFAYTHSFYSTSILNDRKVYYQFQLGSNENNISSEIYKRDLNKVIDYKNNPDPIIKSGTVLMNKQFVKYNNLENKEITFSENNDAISFKIQNYATSLDNVYPQTQDPNSNITEINTKGLKDGSVVYLNKNDYFDLKDTLGISNTDSDVTMYLSFNNKILSSSEKNEVISKIFSKYFYNNPDAYKSFYLTQSGIIVKNVKMVLFIQVSICLISTIIISIVLFFFIKKNIENQKNKIGILKALGYKNKEVAIIFCVAISFVVIAAFVLGFLLGILIQYYFTFLSYYTVGSNLSLLYFSPIIMIFSFIVFPLLFTFISYIIARINIGKDLLFLIYDTSSKMNNKINRVKGQKIKQNISKTPFLLRLSYSFVSKTVSKWVVVFIVFSFSIFLIFFQFNVNAYTNLYINNAYSYVQSDVKIINSTSVDQLDSLSKNKTTTGSQQYHTYDWIPDNQAYYDFNHLKITNDYNSQIIINDPLPTLYAFVFGIDSATKEGGFIPGNDGSAGELYNLFFLKKNYYLSSIDSKKIIDMKMILKEDDEEYTVPVWQWLVTNWTYIESKLNDYASTFDLALSNSQISQIYTLISTLYNYSNTSDDTYPNVFLGNNMLYDSTNECPIISTNMYWNTKYTGETFENLSNLELYGINTYDTNQLDNFFNFNLGNNKKTNKELNNVNKSVLSIDSDGEVKNIEDNSSIKDLSDLERISIPVIISNLVAKTGNFKIGDTITTNTKMSNDYITTNYKVIGISKDDNTSSIFFASHENIFNYIKAYMILHYGIPNNVFPNNYFNKVLIKSSSNGKTLIKQFKNITIFAPQENIYNEKASDTPIISSDRPDLSSYGPISLGLATIYQNNYFTTLTDSNNMESFDLNRNIVSAGMDNLNETLYIVEIFSVFVVAFILFSLISLIFDENKRVILTLKSLGYNSIFISFSVLGFYILVMVIGFLVGWGLSIGIWIVLSKYIFITSGMLISVFASPIVFILAMVITLILIFSNFLIGYISVNKKEIKNITLMD